MRIFLLFFCIVLSAAACGQDNADASIRKLLGDQQDAWNRGDIESFMKGYWKSDSLMFIGAKGVTYGYKNTWERYKKTYDSPEKMGKLKFDLLHVNKMASDLYMVVGKWHLTRTVGDIGGHYTLMMRYIDGNWVIISDHTSG